MAELVGGAFLSSFLSVLFDRMASRPVLDFVSGKKNNNEQLMRQLKMKLLSANQLVDDAEEKQMTSKEVREWLGHLKDALYAVGDLLDEINTEALRRKVEGDDHSGSSSSSSSTSWIMRSIFKTTPSDEFVKALEPKIVNILSELQLILDQKDVLGLKEGVKDRPQERLRQTTSRVDESEVYGRDKDKEIIVELLRSDDATGHKIGVLPIVGMGGIGKTTLAQLVYKDVAKDFGVQAWVCVGEEFDILRIAQTIYGRITAQPCGITDLDLLSGQLEEVLRNKKFLFVLDDFWSSDYSLWNDFMTHFKQYGEHGSKIVVTTRLEHVASKMGTLPTHHLREISEDDCWLLFSKHAFTNAGVVGSHLDLEDIGRKIVKKCKGLPLAAKSLGGLLRSEVNPKQWEKILKSDIWKLQDDKILPALWLSYHYLPAHLKRCFAYCSIFPKDYEFTEQQLVLLWMAEDLLHPEEKEIVEEVGNECFEILLSRSFFQHSTTTDHESGESFFNMHDLMNDLAMFVSGEFCLRLEDPQPLTINVSKTRHFSYMKNGGHGFENFELLYEAKHLHTFLLLSLKPYPRAKTSMVAIHDLLSRLQCLRVLNLSSYDMSELPSSIGNLKHLRHLDLSHTSIEKLPDTVCTLYNLQTLLLSGCDALVQLPTKLGRLMNLRHLDISNTKIEKMPPDMSNLKDLQTLSDFVLDKQTGHHGIVELKKLQHLHNALTISGLNNIVHDGVDLEANILSDKKYLDALVLKWGGGTSEDPERDREVLNKFQPHTNLKVLVIEFYRDISFPSSWLGDPSFSCLSTILLKDCIHCCLLPPLGQLPCLTALAICGLEKVVEIGSEFYYGNDTGGLLEPFKSLEILAFRDMPEWEKWWSYVEGNEGEGVIFPNLLSLLLSNCPKLTEIFPLDKGGSLSHLESKCPKFPSLSYLTIWGCPNFARFPDGGMDAPELKDMRIICCEKLRVLPDQMHILLPSLQILEIRDCPELESFPQGGLPSKLESLMLTRCEKLIANRAQWGLERLNSLRRLSVEEVDCYAFPEEGLLPTTLIDLGIYNLPNLTALESKELRRVISLESFTIGDCPELQCFPEEAPNSLKQLIVSSCPKLQCLPGEWLPASLSYLHIYGCPFLKQRFQRETGEDWHKIAHIRTIFVDNHRI